MNLKKEMISLKSKLVCLLLAAVFLIVCASCGQDKSKSGVSADVRINEEDILNDVVSKTDKGFQFQKIDWKAERAEIKEKVPEASYEEKLTRLKTQEKQGSKEVTVFYNFQDDRFCSGEILLKFDNKSDYEAFLTKIKGQAQDFFATPPMSNSLDDLLNGKEVSWEGNDKSYVRIRPAGQGDYYENTVSIKVEMPKTLFGEKEKPPKIRITAGNKEIDYAYEIKKWHGENNEEENSFSSIMKNDSEFEILNIKLGTVIKIRFSRAIPDTYELKDYILNEKGDVKFSEQTVQTIPMNLNSKTGSFVLKENWAASLSSDSDDYKPGAVLRGFKLTCEWNENKYIYMFMVKTDAMPVS